MLPHFPDLFARLEEKRPAFGGPFVEIRKLLAILAEGDKRRPLEFACREAPEGRR